LISYYVDTGKPVSLASGAIITKPKDRLEHGYNGNGEQQLYAPLQVSISPTFYVKLFCTTEQFTDLGKLNLLTYGGLVLGSSQFTLLPHLPQKTILDLKVVKIDSKIIILVH